MDRRLAFPITAILLLAALLPPSPAQATRRAIRIDFGSEWTAAAAPGSVDCPAATAGSLQLQWRGFEFAALDDPALLAGAYCQRSVDGEFSGLRLNASEEPALAGLVGPNADNATRAVRYAFLDDPNPFVATRGFQWAFFSFPYDFALVALYGVVDEPLDGAATIRRGSQVLWDGGRDGFDGEYFCFDATHYLGRWNGEFSGSNPCLDFIRQRPLLAQVVSRSQPGQLADGYNTAPRLSASGRHVAFTGYANGLVADDQNGFSDVFVFDRAQATVERISQAADGTPGNAASSAPAISADGRFVAFASYADNLVAADGNNRLDIFLKDRQTGAIERLNTPRPNEHCDLPALSADAQRIAYRCSVSGIALSQSIYLRDRDAGSEQLLWSDVSASFQWLAAPPSISADGALVGIATASALLPGDSNGVFDVYVYRVGDAQFERVSLIDGYNGEPDGDSFAPVISADGCLVAFASEATNLVANDGNGSSDVFLRNRCGGGTERVSLTASGNETAPGAANNLPSLSDDGRFVAFQSNDPDFRAAAGVSGSATVVRQRLGLADTRVAATRDAGGLVFDSFAIEPQLSADGLQLVAVASGAAVSDQVIALDQPFIPARPPRVFADGFD